MHAYLYYIKFRLQAYRKHSARLHYTRYYFITQQPTRTHEIVANINVCYIHIRIYLLSNSLQFLMLQICLLWNFYIQVTYQLLLRRSSLGVRKYTKNTNKIKYYEYGNLIKKNDSYECFWCKYVMYTHTI